VIKKQVFGKKVRPSWTRRSGGLLCQTL